jgi:large subunit ribosomal protein L5
MTLQEKYKKEVIPQMKQKFKHKNDFSMPKIEKVVVNVGIGSTVVSKDEKAQESIAKDITLITGQQPLVTLAKKAIAAFKIREGMPLGLKVTLRKKKNV